MPFYRRLVESITTDGNVRMVAVSGESNDVVGKYLKEHELRVHRLVTFRGRLMPTPTILVVDRKGLVRGAWLGQLNEDSEREVFRAAGIRLTS